MEYPGRVTCLCVCACVYTYKKSTCDALFLRGFGGLVTVQTNKIFKFTLFIYLYIPTGQSIANNSNTIL